MSLSLNSAMVFNYYRNEASLRKSSGKHEPIPHGLKIPEQVLCLFTFCSHLFLFHSSSSAKTFLFYFLVHTEKSTTVNSSLAHTPSISKVSHILECIWTTKSLRFNSILLALCGWLLEGSYWRVKLLLL